MNSRRGIGVTGLSVDFLLPDKKVNVLENLTVTFQSGAITGIIGESGSGKSVLGMAMLGILPPYANIRGELFFENQNFAYGSTVQKSLRGKKLGFIPQNPQEAMNPSRKIKDQLMEGLSIIDKNRKENRKRSREILTAMGFNNPEKIMKAYPHELSGGMQQRALSAISVCCNPRWIIADEPTKGLDKALCIQVAETFKGLKKIGVEGMLVITHDIKLATLICDRIFVMYAGRIVEAGKGILENPKHPYTQALLRSMPENSLEPIQDPDGVLASGCIFEPRCQHRKDKCKAEKPLKFPMSDRWVECFLYE